MGNSTVRKIIYLGYYDIEENKAEGRAYPPAAMNKMSYIATAINRAGWNVEIVSASRTEKNKAPGHKYEMSDKMQLKLFPCMGSGNIIKRAMRSVAMQCRLFLYLLKNISEETPLLAYHSLSYMKMLRFLRRIKRFKLILEVEEIYADVIGDNRVKTREMKLFKEADAFLFPTELLDEKINTENKPSAIVYGTYQVEEARGYKFGDGKCHLVYAGTFDPRKGGVQAVVSVAGELPAEYHVHICGFGSEDDTTEVKEQIDRISKVSQAEVSYDGLLSGEDYIRFIQSCDVGLSTQASGAEFNETSFPSKVLSYLANGLRVVSVRLKVLERSKINDLLWYYDGTDPNSIAETIKDIDFSETYNSRDVIEWLDREFVEVIRKLLDE